MTKLYKVLNEDGSCYHGGSGRWSLPSEKPGEWMPPIEPPLKPCQRGYHVLKFEHLLEWLGPAIFEVEVDGEVLWESNKGICSRARLVRKIDSWNERTARLFACDCADRVRDLAADQRSHHAIDVARAFSEWKATAQAAALVDTACDAARAAAWAAGRAAGAAEAAEREWQIQHLRTLLDEGMEVDLC